MGGRENVNPPSIEDVVVIEEDDKPRGLWKLGRIIELITSKDGHIRAAVLRVAGNRILQRPIQKIYPLEIIQQQAQEVITSEEKQIQEVITSENKSADLDKSQCSRPQRAAAVKARKRLTAYAAL